MKPPMTVSCGPLEGHLETCFEVVAATSSGLSIDLQQQRTITEVIVGESSTRPWCAPPDPCISPPPDGYWVTFDWSGGRESIPVYLATGGWLLGVPAPSEPGSTTAPSFPPTAVPDGVGLQGPPPGEIWFGAAFDTMTYAVEDRTEIVSIAAKTAVVATFDRPLVGGGFRFQALRGSEIVYEEVIQNDIPDLVQQGFVVTLSDLGLTPGAYTFRMQEAEGHTLASGPLTLTR